MDKLGSIIDQFAEFLPQIPNKLALAVSGGPDSMALLHGFLKSELFKNSEIHVLSVDHGLRAAAKHEVAMVAQYVLKSDSNFHHHVLIRHEKDAGKTKIQEQARQDRDALINEYCIDHDIAHLFLAHHLDDQAETFLFRLSKGSGLDGLCAMQPVSTYNEITLCRPFLDNPKTDLVSYCDAHDVPYFRDPSNDSEDFARVRLRKSYEFLSEEGLTNKRLAIISKRLSRSKEALVFFAEQTFDQALQSQTDTKIVIDFEILRKAPEEIRLRVMQKAMAVLKKQEGYPVRLEKLEALLKDMFSDSDMKRRTLGGYIFSTEKQKDSVHNGQSRAILIELE